ncbi:tetraacyldisaccharide 4'-kinase [Algiphilus sp.]|uniref:tetraacyldisaccharide 4'-kinase n=1 Tax=Algiphilus sp. TaxID=1872431 RepID=UPI003B524150
MTLRARIEGALNARWYSEQPPPLWLRPLSRLYGRVADQRAQRHRAEAASLPLPVIVVGNLTSGGAGKTPVTIALVEAAQAMGLRVGVVSRGYGARVRAPLQVDSTTSARTVGDEPILIARRTGAPVCVSRDRSQAVRTLAAVHDLDVVIADDGLQHYRMPRTAEICVVDGSRGLGNGWRLPAGPLREPEARLAHCDLVVVNGGGAAGEALARTWDALHCELSLDQAVHLRDGHARPLTDFRGGRVFATAGIAHPARFFDALRGLGLDIEDHPLGDHEAVPEAILALAEQAPLLMTEKDAVKLAPPGRAQCYAVPVTLRWRDAGAARLDTLIRRVAERAAASS